MLLSLIAIVIIIINFDFKISSDVFIESEYGLRINDIHDVCIITRIRNVGYQLPQWIHFHREFGISHFYISDDCSNDNVTISLAKHFESNGLISFYEKFKFLNCENHHPDESLHFRALFKIAKHQCKYISAIDVDEYMFPVKDSHYDKSISQILKEYSEPIVRMPWFVMSSHGYENIPKGLIIENYYKGQYITHHVKTIALTSTIENWRISLYPKFKKNIISQNKYVSEFGNSPKLYDWELNQTELCPIPTSMIYLRHFAGLSYEDFMKGRGSIQKTSNNDTNIWSINPREKWKRLNHASRCTPPGEKFRKRMCLILGSGQNCSS